MTKKRSKKAIISKDEIQNKLKELSLDVQVGDCFLEDDGDYIKITNIDDERIHYEEYNSRDKKTSESSSSFKDWKYYHSSGIKVTKSYKELIDYTFKRILEDDIEYNEPEISTSTAIIEQDTKQNLTNMKNLMEERRKNLKIMERVLYQKKEELSNLAHSLQEKIKKIMKVLCQIELYLGVNEDIIHLQKGQKAPAKYPICFRQQILYMDEEYGAIENGGLDFENVTEFDEWLLIDKHYEHIVHEKKCVVVLRVRRNPKDYKTNNPFGEALLNQANYMTYVLIRNGDNLYRIYSDFIIKPRLFPKRDEIQKMYEDGKKGLWGFDKDKLEEKIFSYQQNFLLLQGLLDRTPIFQPLPHQIQLFLPKTYKGIIKLIYDDEASLTDGRQYYKDWHKELNAKIKRGTRIYFCGFPDYIRYSYEGNRDHGNRRLQYPHAHSPKPGIYNVKRIEKESTYFRSGDNIICHYNPKDEIWRPYQYDDHERKKSIYFWLEVDDWFVLNYDLIDLETIEYYIHSRIDRENYLEVLPILYKIKKMRIEEIAWEKEFVKAMATELGCNEEEIWKAVDWWKHKVIWKRPIRQDDAKAWRMIKGRVKNRL